jgi:hypothetical protein
VSGVAAIRYLLAHNNPLLAVVPTERIMAGDVPLGTPLPAISVTQISSVPRLTVSMIEPKKMHIDRVQVTVLVRDQEGDPQGDGYPGLRSLLKLVLAACPNTRGTVNDVSLDSVLPDIEGPDLSNAAESLLSGSRDFIVKFLE